MEVQEPAAPELNFLAMVRSRHAPRDPSPLPYMELPLPIKGNGLSRGVRRRLEKHNHVLQMEMQTVDALNELWRPGSSGFVLNSKST